MPETPERVSLTRHAMHMGVFLVFVTALVCRIYQLGRNPLWYDEVMYALACRDFSWPVATSQVIRMEPVFYLLLWLWENLGQGEVWMRLHAVAAGLGTVAIAAALGARAAGERGRLLCGLLTALSPFLIFYSRDAKMYSLAAFLALAVAYAALRYADEDGKPWHLALVGISEALLLHTHVLSVCYVAALNLAFLVLFARTRRKILLWLCVQLAVGLAALPYFLVLFHQGEASAGQIFWAPPPDLSSLLRTWRNLCVGYSSHVEAGVAGSSFFALLILLGLLRMRGFRRQSLFLVLVALGNVFALYFVSRLAPWSLYVDRYLIGSAPCLLTAAGIGLASLRPKWLAAATALALLCFLLPLQDLYAYRFSADQRDHLGVYKTIDMRALAGEIEREGQPSDAIWHVAWHPYATSQWYAPGYAHYAVEMAGELNDSIGDLATPAFIDLYGFHAHAPEQARQESGRVWLILPECAPEMYARYHGILAWLDARAEQQYHRNFGGRFANAALYCYAFPEPSTRSTQRPSAEAPLVPQRRAPEAAHTGRLEATLRSERSESQQQDDGIRLHVQNRSSQPQQLYFESVTAGLVCGAPQFDRAMGEQSRWRLQSYRDREQARTSYCITIGSNASASDLLKITLPLERGAYRVFVQRITSANPHSALAAPIILTIGARSLPASGAASGIGDGWHWVYAGEWEKTLEGSTTLSLRALKPAGQPEGIAVFSQVIFCQDRSSTPQPQEPPGVSRGRLYLEAMEARELPLETAAGSTVSCVVATEEISTRVWRYEAD